MIASVISYNFYNGADMQVGELNLSDIISYLPRKTERGRDITCMINTCIKTHNWDNDREFVIKINGGKIKNPHIISEINTYLKKNDARSYFYEGLRSAGNGKYYLMWGS